MKAYRSLCRQCGVPVLLGRVDRTLHPACDKTYYSAQQKVWYEKNLSRERGKRRASTQKYREEKPKNRLLSSAKNRAKENNIPFNLEIEDIPDWDVCPILGVRMEKNTRYAPSLDRIQPELGYVKGNVQVISYKANAMKQDATRDELERFAAWVLKN